MTPHLAARPIILIGERHRATPAPRHIAPRALKGRRAWTTQAELRIFSLFVPLSQSPGHVQMGNQRRKPHILWYEIFSLLLVGKRRRAVSFQEFESIFYLAWLKKEGTIDPMEFFGANRSHLGPVGKSTGRAKLHRANSTPRPIRIQVSLLALTPSATHFAPHRLFGTRFANAAAGFWAPEQAAPAIRGAVEAR